MMPFLRYACFAVFLVVLGTGCTIEKRVHTGGYYIQWHKRHREPKGNEQVQKKEEPDTLVAKTPEDTVTVRPVKIPEPVEDTAVAGNGSHGEKVPREERRFEPLGVRAAELLVPAFLVTLLDDQAETHRQDVWLSIAFVAILGLCFVLGIVSMVRYLRNPRAYKFNIWAILAILIPLIFFLLLAFGVAALF